MLAPVLTTKLYLPPPRSNLVFRPRLIKQLNAGLERQLTLISAPAGFGKTMLLSQWLTGRMQDEGRTMKLGSDAAHASSLAWLSLDVEDSEPTRFLTYLVAAMQTLEPQFGAGVLAALQSPQPPPIPSLLTTLLNEIGTFTGRRILVLDDYHLIESAPVDQALTFLLDHLPPQLHLVIATREDPNLPLARYRARGQLSELRSADLRFSPVEVSEYLNQVMGLNLGPESISTLDARTEGWIAGLHLAAISLQGQSDAAGFIAAFTGGHQFILDYLVEEVVQQQPAPIQQFLLHTSILDQMCGELCDAVVKDEGRTMKDEARAGSSDQAASYILQALERANLFIVPLDSERRWYRYHHLFGDLLRKRLGQSHTPDKIATFHIRASEWYEAHNRLPEAFQHAAAANDIDRAERLIESRAMPLHLRSTSSAILGWLGKLPKSVLDAHPSLWAKSATLALVGGQTTGVAERLDAAERGLPTGEPDERTRNLIGVIAAARATLAVTQYQAETIMLQARRALDYLPPDNLQFRFTAFWTLAFAHHIQGDRVAAIGAYREARVISQQSGDQFSAILVNDSLGQLQEQENQLYAAAESYQRVLDLCGDHPQPNAGEAGVGLARIYYEWNDLTTAEQYAQQSLSLLQQYDSVIDRFILAELFLVRLRLAQDDVPGAASLVSQTEQSVRRRNFMQRMPEVAATQVLVLLRQGDTTAAAQLAQSFELPLSQARVQLACSESAAALALLEPLRQQFAAKGWHDEQLRTMVLEALAHNMQGETEQALQLLAEALTLAEPGGFIRLFVDEGWPMRQLLVRMKDQGGRMKVYLDLLLAAFETPQELHPASLITHPSLESLSQRELEILRLVAQGLSNQEIGERLYLSLSTIKGHNRRIFDKLQVQRRTEAIARARELGLL
jgi:LuxR family maltose regulon positive regulatory protein